MGMSSSPKIASSSRDRRSPSSSDPKSLTPQRKHRKMLKDGSSEVWPESVEKTFVEGLRQYWESPWATYSRGRSRWRNQFLVDYLRDAGITRSKKQVASHIQVLRNMWKGEPEYQLVAGGEELFQENGLLAPKQQSPESVSSEVHVKEEQRELQSPLTPDTPSDGSDFAFDKVFPSQLSGLQMLDFPPPESASNPYLAPLPLLSPAADDMRERSVKDEVLPLPLSFPLSEPANPSFISQSLPPPHFLRAGITAMSLWAEGMQPLTVDVARAHPSPAGRVSIHIKLALSSLNDLSSPPTLHGFQGSVSFSAPWSSAQCVTRVYASGVCDSEEAGVLENLNAPGGPLPPTAVLPDSWLSRCKWRNAAAETRIVQQLVVDNVDVAWIVYDLVRPARGPPAAELVAVKRERGERPLSAPTPLSAAYQHAAWSPAHPAYASYTPRATHEPASSSLFAFTAPPSAAEPALAGSGGGHAYTYPSSALFS